MTLQTKLRTNAFARVSSLVQFGVVSCAMMLATHSASAQDVPDAAPKQQRRSFAFVADSIAKSGDSVRAVEMLDSAIKRSPKDAEMWHRYGLILWSMSRSQRNPNYIKDQKVVRRLSAADTALRLAAQLAPDSIQFIMDLIAFNQGSGYSSVRMAAQGELKTALATSERIGDSLHISKTADELGMFSWREYEVIGNRSMTEDLQSIQISSSNNWDRGKAEDYVNSFAHKIEPPTGKAKYNEAMNAFQRATYADPTSLRANRHVLMALADKKMWPDMIAEARRRLSLSRYDYQAWMAMGLAQHRMNLEKEASAAFDSAYALLDDETQARYNRLTRILRPTSLDKKRRGIGDSISYEALASGNRQGVENMYWLLADPLTLTAENEFRIEYLSRITYAELRWTDELNNSKGADTDRGDIHVRYGPPDVEMTVAGGSSPVAGVATLVWIYKKSHLVFFFDLAASTFGTAKSAFFDKDAVNQIKTAIPVSWDNVASTRFIDTIPIRVSRFRAGTDSVDAVVAAGIPLDSMVRNLGIAGRIPVDVDIRLYDEHAQVRGVESVQSSINADSAPAFQRREWIRRVGPGLNLLRIEALQRDSKHAARALTTISPERFVGYSMSDILIGNKPTLANASTGAARWTDVKIEPGLGVYQSGSPIGLVWENYDLTARGGSSNYKIQVSFERVTKGGAAGIVARIADGLGRTVGKEAKGASKVAISFDRKVAANPIVVEYLSVDLANSPAGDYRLSVEITDLLSLKKMSRQSTFTIRNTDKR